MATLRMKDFAAGVPLTVTLQSLETNEAPDNGYGPAVVFSLQGGSLYLPPGPAQQVYDEIRTLAVQAGEPIRIIKQKGGRFAVERELYRPPAHVPAPPPVVGHVVPIAAPPAPVAMPVQVPQAVNTMQSRMMACFMAAIDAVAEAQSYADRRGLKVTFTSEDVRSCAISCYIQCGKEGR